MITSLLRKKGRELKKVVMIQLLKEELTSKDSVSEIKSKIK